jgi:O-antigen ligase
VREEEVTPDAGMADDAAAIRDPAVLPGAGPSPLELAWLPFPVALMSSFYWWGRIPVGAYALPLGILYLPLLGWLWVLSLGVPSSNPWLSRPVRIADAGSVGLVMLAVGASLSLFGKAANPWILLELLVYGLFFILIRNTFTTRRGLEWMVAVIVFCITCLAVEGLYRFFVAKTIWRLGAGDVHTYTNMGAYMFQAGLILAVARLTVADRRAVASMLPWAATALLAPALVFSYSRGAWLTSAIGLGVLMWQRKALALVAAGAVVVSAPVLPSAVWNRVLSAVDFGSTSTVYLGDSRGRFLEAEVQNTTRLRVSNQKRALATFLDHPLTGIGVGAYHGESGGKGEYAPHNAYLRILSETGVVGFTGFSVLLAFVWRRVFPPRRAESAQRWWVLRGFQALFLTHLAYLFLADWPYQLYFWLFLGLACVAGEVADHAPGGANHGNAWAREGDGE